MNRDAPMPRTVREVLSSERTLEGAGVPVRRAFGNRDVPKLDPFLLLDDLRVDDPMESLPGFPWHPHRGIETITYIVDGRVEHEDSLGNRGVILPGGVQWMTAGSGIIHQEMPKPDDGRVGGFQLWLNLPREHKMRLPRYREIDASGIPRASLGRGGRAQVISGRLGEVAGAAQDLSVDVDFFDVRLEPGARFDHAVPRGHTAFAYVLEGEGDFDDGRGRELSTGHLAIYGEGDGVHVAPRRRPLRFLYASGAPLREPVAWWGPIVMNTRKEILEAVDEFQHGTFIKHRPAGSDAAATA